MCGLLHQFLKFRASCPTHLKCRTHASLWAAAPLTFSCQRIKPRQVAASHLMCFLTAVAIRKHRALLQQEGNKAISPLVRVGGVVVTVLLRVKQKLNTLAQIQGARLLACALVCTDRACLVLSGASLTGHPDPNNCVPEQNVLLLTHLIFCVRPWRCLDLVLGGSDLPTGGRRRRVMPAPLCPG